MKSNVFLNEYKPIEIFSLTMLFSVIFVIFFRLSKVINDL